MKTMTITREVEIRRFSEQIRLETVKELVSLGTGHVGGCMSVCELLGVLYSGVMNADPGRPTAPDRDMLICSKGHAGPAVYAALALRGFMPLSELQTLNRPGTHLPSHCDRNLTRGIDMTTGSLGQGLSAGAGAALGLRLDGRNSYVYVIVGDGELQEGQVWEAVMAAAQYRLSNLVAFIDHNKFQINGAVEDVNGVGDLESRFKSFKWNAITVDGHDVKAIYKAVAFAKAQEGPTAVILETIKGYGCKYALEQPRCHSLKMPADKLHESIELIEKRIADLDRQLEGVD